MYKTIPSNLDRAPRVALAGWFGSDNLGDELILHSLISSVRSRGAEPFAVSIRRDQTLQGINSVTHRSPMQHRTLVQTLSSVDAIAVAGGVIQSETSPWNIPFHTSRLRAATKARCPAATIGMGVGHVPGLLSRSLVRRTLCSVSVLVVRDHDSAKRLRMWGIPGAQVGADPVLSLKPVATELDDAMCVILRPINRRGLRTAAAKSRTGLTETRLNYLAEAIDAASTATNLTPRFVAFQASRDNYIHQAVADRMNVTAELIVPTLDTVLNEVARCRLVITMRYHGAIAALLHNRPSVLIDYSPKMTSLATEGNGWASILHPSRITAHRLVAAASAAFDAAKHIPEAQAVLQSRLTRNDAALDALIADALSDD